MESRLDRFRGCLIGGAAGDALGYAVEFASEPSIFARYGKSGITAYELEEELARVSDDTQMTLFTANGLLYGHTRGCMRGIMAPYASYIAMAYRDWYKTQTGYDAQTMRGGVSSWLMNVPELFVCRAPGTTCLSSCLNGCAGTVEQPINHSKGCGGVMRVAPVGLFMGPERASAEKTARLGADAAALTHGHEMGYIPAALMASIVRALAHGEAASPREAVENGLNLLEQLFPDAEYLPGFRARMERAVRLSHEGLEDTEAIHALGEGWCGDEALAIAVYCAVKYDDDFDRCIIAAVNHRGDSDSTGAIAGNILGAHLGLSGIPEKYTRQLEMLDVITQIADDLHTGCTVSESQSSFTPGERAWMQKYVDCLWPVQG